MRELAWMALLKYIQLKSTRKQPLPDPNGKLSPLSGIFAANACWCRQTIATELNALVW